MLSRPRFHWRSTWKYSCSTSAGSAKNSTAGPRSRMRLRRVVARAPKCRRAYQERSTISTSSTSSPSSSTSAARSAGGMPSAVRTTYSCAGATALRGRPRGLARAVRLGRDRLVLPRAGAGFLAGRRALRAGAGSAARGSHDLLGVRDHACEFALRGLLELGEALAQALREKAPDPAACSRQETAQIHIVPW